MPKSRKLNHKARMRRLADIFDGGPQRAAKLRAWVTLSCDQKRFPRQPLPIDKFEENDSYILVRYEPVVPKERVTDLILEVQDFDGAVLEKKRVELPGFYIGAKLALTSPIGPTV